MQSFLIRNIRKIVYFISLSLALGFYFYFVSSIEVGALRDIRLTEAYALTAVSYLYLAMLASPLYAAFPNFPLRIIYVKARRALGVSTFFFAALHVYFAFFKLLGGFAGLGFLSGRYLLAITLSFAAFLILTAMAATSFDWAVRKLGKKWKIIHRFVYLAGILIIVHGLLIGSQYQNLTSTTAEVSFAALLLLFILEAIRIDKYIVQKKPELKNYSPVFVAVISALVLFTYLYAGPGGSPPSSFNIHAEHLKIAQQLQNNPAGSSLKRFTASFETNGALAPGQNVQLIFKVFEADTGTQVKTFDLIQGQLLHLVIVDSSLNYFSHIHPALNDGIFSIDNVFPKNDAYHLYINFQPAGSFEQQFGFTLNIGNPSEAFLQAQKNARKGADQNLAKIFGNYEVTLKNNNLQASLLNTGAQTITFEIKDAKTHAPITNIQPYLGSFGHLVMINEDSYLYIHIHPSAQNVVPFAGPDIEFFPLALYRPIDPGVYRAFGQFKINDKILVADFTVNVK